jgi:hypothetical protein
MRSSVLVEIGKDWIYRRYRAPATPADQAVLN